MLKEHFRALICKPEVANLTQKNKEKFKSLPESIMETVNEIPWCNHSNEMLFSPLSPSGDQYQISPCNINA